MKFTLRHRLDEAARAVLREDLRADFCDEDAPRPGHGFLAPDVRITISEGRTRRRWNLMVHRIPHASIETSETWIRAELHAAAKRIGARIERRT